MTSVQEPSNADVLQFEQPELVTVPVDVQGPVRVQDVPSVTLGIGTDTLDTTGKQLLAPDPRRRCATIYAFDQNIVISHSQAGLVSGATWPKNVALVLTTQESVWAKSATSTTEVSLIIEGWVQ